MHIGLKRTDCSAANRLFLLLRTPVSVPGSPSVGLCTRGGSRFELLLVLPRSLALSAGYSTGTATWRSPPARLPGPALRNPLAGVTPTSGVRTACSEPDLEGILPPCCTAAVGVTSPPFTAPLLRRVAA